MHLPWRTVLLVALAGAAGALARWGLGRFVQRNLGAAFPFGTLTVNLLGCLCFGLVWQLTENRPQPASEVRLVVLTGFMGAFTTFSTFAFESWALLGEGQPLAALANVAASAGLGLLAVAVGVLLARGL